MKKQTRKILSVILICFMIITILGCNVGVYAAASGDAAWWTKAGTFFDDTRAVTVTPTTMLDSLIDILKILGNAVIIIVTMFLGVKYIYGSAEGKVDVKEGLSTLVVAMLFFYFGTNMYDIFINGGKLTFIDSTTTGTISNVFSTFVYIANFAAVGGIIYLGVKYLMAGAEGKAALKAKGLPFVIGLVMAFSSISILNIILKIIGDVTPT